MGFFALGAYAAGVGLQAYGQYQAGKAAHDEANYLARVARQDAAAARQKAQFDQLRQLKLAAKKKGALKAKLAASGADIGVGTPILLQEELAEELELENRLIGHEGEVAAMRYESEAELHKVRGDNARSAGRINMTNTLLQGFGMGAMFAKMGGMFSGQTGTFSSASTGSGPYAGTMGGGPTGGASRSMIG
jgi:hypothetical protein